MFRAPNSIPDPSGDFNLSDPVLNTPRDYSPLPICITSISGLLDGELVSDASDFEDSLVAAESIETSQFGEDLSPSPAELKMLQSNEVERVITVVSLRFEENLQDVYKERETGVERELSRGSSNAFSLLASGLVSHEEVETMQLRKIVCTEVSMDDYFRTIKSFLVDSKALKNLISSECISGSSSQVSSNGKEKEDLKHVSKNKASIIGMTSLHLAEYVFTVSVKIPGLNVSDKADLEQCSQAVRCYVDEESDPKFVGPGDKQVGTLVIDLIQASGANEDKVNDETPLQVKMNGVATIIGKIGLSLGGGFISEHKAIKLIKVEPFNSVKKKMRVLIQFPQGGYRAHCIGASKIVLASCNKVLEAAVNVAISIGSFHAMIIGILVNSSVDNAGYFTPYPSDYYLESSINTQKPEYDIAPFNAMLNVSVKLNNRISAAKLFDEMTKRNLFLWNPLIGEFNSNQLPQMALEFVDGIKSLLCDSSWDNEFIPRAEYVVITPDGGLQICGNPKELVELMNELVGMYRRRKVFDPGGLIIIFTSISLLIICLDGVELF